MIVINNLAAQKEHLSSADEIVLNGPPHELEGWVTLSNKTDSPLRMRSLALEWQKKSLESMPETAARMGAEPLRVLGRMKPGEEKRVNVLYKMDSTTPPGVYTAALNIGEENREVTMIVQPHIYVSVQPLQLHFLGSAPGTKHTALLTLYNAGNVPFTIPNVSHVASLDMDLLCRAFGVAMRHGGAKGYEGALDEVSQNIQKNLPDWAEGKIEEQGNVLAPGQQKVVTLHITMPKNSIPTRDYSGSLRFWDKEIAYVIRANHV